MLSDPSGRTPAAVDVCVCTYRRPSLAETLRSLKAQAGLKGAAVRVIVADNDETPSAQRLAETTAEALGLDLTYVHAPARNISVARNACLDAVRTPLFAFIDDDEQATPGWLATLLATQAQTGADVVFGPVQALYAETAPAWIRTADLHTVRPFFRDGVIEGGYCGNVLIRTDALGALRFDPALGRSGGEDTWFFHQLTMAGRRLVFSAEALALEETGSTRETLAWLMRRSYRAGQTHARILATRRIGKGRIAGLAAAKALYCLGTACVLGLSTGGRNRALVRGALHVGVLARLAGRRNLILY